MPPPFKRTRTGCFTCRGDGYKCDEQKPHCGRCVRLRKTCQGYGVRLRWRDPEQPQLLRGGPKRRSGCPPMTPLVSSSSPPDVLLLLPAEQRYLLWHWTTTVAGIVSATAGPAGRNPFLEHLTPMLPCSGALRAALCALAASHLAALRDDSSSSSSSLRTLASRHQLRAVSALRRTLHSSHDHDHDPRLSLATILMLQLADRLFPPTAADDDDVVVVVDHLAGAHALLRQGGGAEKTTTTWKGSAAARFLTALCRYHDVLASVARGAPPRLLDADDGDGVGDGFLRELHGVLTLIARISMLHGRDPAYRRAHGAAVEAALRALDDDDERAEPGRGGDGDDADAAAAWHTTRAYRHAAAIYLHRVVTRRQQQDSAAPDPDPDPRHHARRCLAHLQQVPVAAPLAAAHAWPLWTAGCEAVGADLRAAAAARAEAMYAARRFPALRRLRADMAAVWEAKDAARSSSPEGVDDVDCIQVIRRTRRRETDLV
ncbi:fungal-specific transcription factor domain-containing protein [Xylariomycetidae sp. FL0641]|nr:fungal-specific transcription factor domain-containing protein [Xylariomycetidae sp. FL0641]